MPLREKKDEEGGKIKCKKLNILERKQYIA
jgi:hypothetical protein